MYKLIAIDLDGTLLNSYGEISKEDKEYLQELIKQGIKVVLTSGRTNSAMENFAEELGANEYMICGNGANIYDIQNKRNIYNQYLSKEKILQIAKITEQNSIYYNVYTENSIITKSLNYNTLFYYSENNKKPENKKTNIEIVENISQYIKDLNVQNFLKVTVCDEESMIFNRIMKKLKQIKGVDVLEVSHMARKLIKYGREEKEIQYYYTEISNKNVNKWRAIEHLIRELSILPEEVIAIGDNINDISMLQNAGKGIAMENSAPLVKEQADFITKDNNSSGVSKALKVFLN